MEKYLILLMVTLGTLTYCECSKILAVFPMPSPSHAILGDAYAKLLLEAGHEVTYITPYPKKVKTNPKLHVIDASELQKFAPSKLVSIQKVVDNDMNTFTQSTQMFSFLINIVERTIKNDNVQALINDQTQQFDLVILQFVFSEVLSGFAALYDCPFIWATSVAPDSMVLRLTHESNNPSYTADLLSANVPPFTFTQRVKSLFAITLISATKNFYMAPKEKVLYEEIFGPLITKRGRTVPSYDELIYNGSFVLSNFHETLGTGVSLPSNCKMIAGYHIDIESKPMPKDLQQIMDNAKNGVVYFSMGSNLKSKDIPEVLKQDLLKVLGGLKQTVIWKFEEELPNLPANVHILKWAPQQNILAHKNIRLFITHGGLGSTIETIHFGVPVITIPVFADQFGNAEKAVVKGYGLKVDLGYDMAKFLKAALEEIFSNSKYAEKAKELSMIYHARPVPPAKELVHWVEYVIKTRGAPHLRSSALLVPWYQKCYLDFAVLVLAVLITVRLVANRLFRSKKTEDNKKKRN